MISLIDLEPRWLRFETRTETWRISSGPNGESKDFTGPREYRIPVNTFAEAQGLWFLCPKCFKENGGVRGTHGAVLSFKDRGVLPNQATHNSKDEPVYWEASGTDFRDLTLMPSIQHGGGCNWHGYITSGKIRDA